MSFRKQNAEHSSATQQAPETCLMSLRELRSSRGLWGCLLTPEPVIKLNFFQDEGGAPFPSSCGGHPSIQ